MHCLAPPPKLCIPQDEGEWLSPCSEASFEPAQSWTSDTSLVFTSLNQIVHIFPGCQQDFSASLTLAGTTWAPAPSQVPQGCTNLWPNSPDTSKGLRWPCIYSHPGDTVTCFLWTKRKDLFAACTQTVLNAQGGGKFSTFLDPALSYDVREGITHTGVMNKKGLLLCLQVLNVLVYLQTQADQMWSGIHLAPHLPTGQWEERCPNGFLFHTWEQEMALDDTKPASAIRWTSMCCFSTPQIPQDFYNQANLD